MDRLPCAVSGSSFSFSQFVGEDLSGCVLFREYSASYCDSALTSTLFMTIIGEGEYRVHLDLTFLQHISLMSDMFLVCICSL